MSNGRIEMLQVKRVTDSREAIVTVINELYEKAFPLHEQRTRQGRIETLLIDNYYLSAWFDNELFVGFIGAWKFGDLFYIEHFAISENHRGAGYGSKILTTFCQQHKRVILEIDPVVDEVSTKRLNFYQNNNFHGNDMAHYHPSYHADMLPHPLMILSYPRILTEQEYQLFNDGLVQQVMNKAIL